MSQLPTSL